MGMLLAFAPFIAFAVVDRLVGSPEGLLAGFAVSAAILARDWLSATRKPKSLEIATAILFGLLAAYALILDPAWSVIGVRLLVDAGLLAIVLASILIRRPFTLQYAREQASEEAMRSPEFLRTNYVISAAWALAFAVLVAADLLMIYLPDLHRFGIIVTILALIGAFKFTDGYPARQRAIAR
ncbi:MAG: hypothetical protein U1E61_10570 [Bradyrhizobium sp.]